MVAPSASTPAGLLLVGDSFAGGLSPFLERALSSLGETTLTTDYKVSSGLVRNDFFDWPAHLAQTMPSAGARVVVAMFGANDGQSFHDMPNVAVDSDQWKTEYAKRVDAMIDLLTAGGRQVIWVGVPDAQDPDLTAHLSVQNEVAEAEVAKHPTVVFVDTWKYFSGISGGFAPLIRDPRTGAFVATRSTKDGFHPNTEGEEILAAYVSQAVVDVLAKLGADVSTASTLPQAQDGAASAFYVVVDGDSLSKIAGQVGTTVSAIVAANGWDSAEHLIYAGMKLKMPTST
ncbi:MAG: hypothetical protein JWM34_1095 [Ilumatobacteraceae bacterium]|nr:hypothetical protein [Ilumatobacteraceae bacterium]